MADGTGSHRRVRRAALLAAMGALALAAAGCGDDGDSGSTGAAKEEARGAKIAFLLPESKTARYEKLDRPAFLQGVEELCPDCEVLYNNADQDPTRQQQQAEAAITAGAKVLVVGAVDVKSASAIAARAEQAGVPVVSYSRLISGPGVDYYISIDPFRVGRQQAQVLLDALGGGNGKRIVMINGSPTDSNAKPYKDGARQELERAGAKIVKQFDTPDWSPDKAQSQMEQTITALGRNGFDAVYVANDGMAGGVIAALKGAGIDPADKPVTGQDAEVAAVQRILSGEQLMTVYLPIREIAGTAARLAVPLARGEEPPAIAKDRVDNGATEIPSVLLDTVAVDQDNVRKVVEAGVVEARELCRGRYAAACEDAGVQ